MLSREVLIFVNREPHQRLQLQQEMIILDSILKRVDSSKYVCRSVEMVLRNRIITKKAKILRVIPLPKQPPFSFILHLN